MAPVLAFLGLTNTEIGQALLGVVGGSILIGLRKVFHQGEKIHILVNGRLSEALDRIASLEKKLGLQPGEQIPTAQVVTPKTKEPKN